MKSRFAKNFGRHLFFERVLGRKLFSVGLVVLISFFIGPLAFAEAPTPQSVWANQSGIEDLKKTNPAAAQEKFIRGLSRTPFEPKLQMNLGLTFEMLGQVDKAQSSYETALKLSQDNLVSFAANFNMGEMKQKEKKKEEALKYYQEALKYNPESLETKVNIELLTKSDKGGGKGKNDDKKDQDKNQDKKDDEKKEGDSKDPQDDKDKDKDKKDPKDQKDQKKQYGKNKPQPQKFKSEDLTQGDVNKILGEIKQQEQKIRADYNKREVKEKPNDKDW